MLILKKIIEISHKNGSLVLIDGAQGAPHSIVDVQDLDVDFYVFSGHKLYGPTGIGILYGKKHLLEKINFLFGLSQINWSYIIFFHNKVYKELIKKIMCILKTKGWF